MKKVALFFLALFGLPLVWVLGWSILEALAIDAVEGIFFTAGRIGFAVGCVVMTALYVWKGRALQILYIFAHEMTHAITGLFFLAKVHKVSITTTGGFVQLSKTNVLITLAPYCVPFYLLLVVFAYGLVQWFAPNVAPFWVWAVLFGMTATFHVWYTANALFSVSQPDTHEYGRFFSWWFIWVANCCFVILSIVITSPNITLREQGRRLVKTSVSTYVKIYHQVEEITTPLLRKTSTIEREDR